LIETLRDFDAMGFVAMIPGHGGVRRGNAHLRSVLALFTSIVDQAATAARDGLSLEDARRRVDIASHRPYFVTDEVSARYWDFFTAEAVRRAWEEARGN
jgi:hypothetical protein